jgi:hypothetical protein
VLLAALASKYFCLISNPFDFLYLQTHCGSRCSGCQPKRFVETLDNFKEECASEGRKNSETYPFDQVQKAIHLIRNPFDNIVSRFHLKIKTGRAISKDSSREAFRNFCFEDNQNANDSATLQMLLSKEQFDIIEKVPCRAEFFRYVHWHNHAFETCNGLGIETLLIHYGWYESNFSATTSALLDFLGLKKKSEPAPFIRGKVYSEHFTEEEKTAVKTVLHSLASSETWAEIERYFH